MKRNHRRVHRRGWWLLAPVLVGWLILAWRTDPVPPPLEPAVGSEAAVERVLDPAPAGGR